MADEADRMKNQGEGRRWKYNAGRPWIWLTMRATYILVRWRFIWTSTNIAQGTQATRRSAQFKGVAVTEKGEVQFYAPSLGRGLTEVKMHSLKPWVKVWVGAPDVRMKERG